VFSAWGYNSYGETGNGNTTITSTPTQVSPGKSAQTITFAALAAKTLGDVGFSLGATASSGLAVTYVSSNTAVATVSGSTVTVVGAGSTDITASQAGNGIYEAATDVVQTLSVTRPYPLLNNKLAGGEGFLVILHPDSGILSAGYNTTVNQLGLGVSGNQNTFQVTSSATDWRHVDAGSSYTLALKNDITLWGYAGPGGARLGARARA
jgi:alpha-tubulin suppressor-like RCC1 family protein